MVKLQLLTSIEVLTLETSVFESLYGGQFTLSTQLIKPNYLVKLQCSTEERETTFFGVIGMFEKSTVQEIGIPL